MNLDPLVKIYENIHNPEGDRMQPELTKSDEAANTFVTGNLRSLPAADVVKVIGFEPKQGEGGYIEWSFRYQGALCTIWSYLGNTAFNTRGPHIVFKNLFGSLYTPTMYRDFNSNEYRPTS